MRKPLTLMGSLSFWENEGGFASMTVNVGIPGMFDYDLAEELAKWAGVYAEVNRGGNVTTEGMAVRRVKITIEELD